MDTARHDSWTAGNSYERYMGRWSRLLATRFLDWLAAPAGLSWLDLGCGSGALSQSILNCCTPRSVLGIDPSAEFVAHAAAASLDTRAEFICGSADSLPCASVSLDVVASGLAFNFFPDAHAALLEMQRVLKPGALLCLYVWDYPGGGVGFIDAFWQAAAELDSQAALLDERLRFPGCTPAGLRDLCQQAGIASPGIEALEIRTEFSSFDDFWQPFTLGSGPAPGYCMSLPAKRREALRARLATKLDSNCGIAMQARAWALQARMAHG